MTPVVSQFVFLGKKMIVVNYDFGISKFAEPFKKKCDHVQIPTAIKIRVVGFSLRF